MMRIFKGSLLIISVVFLSIFISCEEEFTTIGTDIINNGGFNTQTAQFNVYASTRTLNAVRTNSLPVYRIGEITNPLFGKSRASVTAQVQLSSSSPRFGNLSQDQEDEPLSNENPTRIQENETVTRVVLEIPFFTVNSLSSDRDRDGVLNDLDADPDDPNSDTDGDGISDVQETASGTDPLNPDTDGDGIPDNEDDDTRRNAFPLTFELDSIIGNPEANFNLRIDESTFFLRDFDPNNNFENAQEYFSNMDFSSFRGVNLFNGPIEIRNTETLVFAEDNPDTEDIDESENVAERIPPGIFVELDPNFFQTNLLDLEGQQLLTNNSNFTQFFRGIQISTEGHSEDLMMILNLNGATITVEYTFDRVNQNGTTGDISDDIIEEDEGEFELNIGGNTGVNAANNIVNTFVNDPLPTAIQDEINLGTDATRLYLNGGAGAFVELNLFDEEGNTDVLEEVRANGWLINEANLSFFIDRDQLDAAIGNQIDPFRVYLYDLTNNVVLLDWLLDPTEDGLNQIASRSVFGGIIEVDSEDRGIRYNIRITRHVNEILRNGADNVRLGLSVSSNINNPVIVSAIDSNAEEVMVPQASIDNPFGIVLFGANTSPENEDQRLRLEIIYTEPAENQ